jgi:hypothetical protein
MEGGIMGYYSRKSYPKSTSKFNILISGLGLLTGVKSFEQEVGQKATDGPV